MEKSLREAKQTETAHFQAELARKARIAERESIIENTEKLGVKLPRHLTSRQFHENLRIDKTKQPKTGLRRILNYQNNQNNTKQRNQLMKECFFFLCLKTSGETNFSHRSCCAR